ncbi:MAG: glycosyltransferase, partial [Acidimicrobiales bacterium]|nr:glycosyltransferase [Acidimicrobiales bacterium]
SKQRNAILSTSVSVVIPFRDQAPLLHSCLETLMQHTGLRNVEYLLVNNGSVETETIALMRRLKEKKGVRIIDDPRLFNWSQLNNLAASKSDSEVLVFVNNDIECQRDEWLEPLVIQARRPGVGAVGARLLYPDNRVQHGGIVLVLNSFADHAFRDLPGEEPGYFGLAKTLRNVSAVTGAVLATSRTCFTSVGGFDESFAVAFNDIDYCLRLQSKGWRIVYEPSSELVHHESRSRGSSDDTKEAELFSNRWGDLLKRRDPYFHPALSLHNAWYALDFQKEFVNVFRSN